MSFPDLEDSHPEEPDTDDCKADDRGREEMQDEEDKEDIVHRENLGRQDKYPVDRVKDVDIPQDIATALLADRVLGFVDSGE
jgi:hypothetical protein